VSRGRNSAPPLRPQLKLVAASTACSERPLTLGPLKYPASSSQLVEPNEPTRFENRSFKCPGSCTLSADDPKLYGHIQMTIRGGERRRGGGGTHLIAGLFPPPCLNAAGEHTRARSRLISESSRSARRRRKKVFTVHSTDDQNSSVVRFTSCGPSATAHPQPPSGGGTKK
jgi:hypothetical protein